MTHRQPPYWPHRCPTCSRFVGDVRWWHNAEHVVDVRGVCKTHGDVQLSGASWDWDLLSGQYT